MAFSSGAQRDLYYAIEDSFGVPPSTLTMTEVRNTEDTISLARDNFVSNERRGDRGIHDMRLGNKQPAGDINFEFSYESFDDFMAAALCADYDTSQEDLDDAWEAPYALTGTSAIDGITVDKDDKTITRATGSWITDGLRVGDVITIAGFTEDGPPDETVNNQTTQITALTATVITVSSTTLEDTDSARDSIEFTTSATEIKKGTTVTSFVIERYFIDVTQYQLYTGGIINGFSLDLAPNGMVTGGFSFLFKDAENASSAYHDGDPVDVETNRPFDSFTGYINENNTASEVLSALNFSLDNGFERNFVLMADTCPQMTSGRSNVTGSITAYFENKTLYDKFVNETESSLEVGFQDNNLNGYVITLPRVKYTSAETPVNSDGAIINTMNFQALDDATEASNIIIRKQPKITA
jgi:hypothetical protein